MDANNGGSGNRRQGRRWRFASALLDEASWALLVDGQRVAVETKPMELLHELLLRNGQVVSKDELLGAVWPDVSVVEASLPTAIRKLRQALHDEDPASRIIETVPRIGYRLAVPVALVDSTAVTDRPAPTPGERQASHAPTRRWPMTTGALLSLVVIGGLGVAWMLLVPSGAASQSAMQRDALIAIRQMDVDRVQALLNAGWNPNTPIDEERDTALTMVLNICEWNPGHDRSRLLLLTRTMIEGGADVMARNAFGDTAYSIAKAPRYCGPDHPVTRMLHAGCYNPPNGPRDRCLATYELARRRGPAPSPAKN